MSTSISSLGSDFVSSMLGNSSSSSSSSLSSLTDLLGDYGAIRNGSYLKLAKHYYETDGATESTKEKFSNSTTSATTTTSEDKLTKASAESAWEDITALRSEKLYTADSDGTYDTDTLLKDVKAFVSSYNSVLDSAEDSDNTNVLSEASRLVSQTENYSSSLSKIGITIASDNSLKLDEAAFAAADIDDIKSVFASDFSFGSNTQSRLLQMVSDASGTVSGLYTSSATTSSSTVGSLYDTFL